MSGEGNGNVIRWRLDKLEHRVKGVEHGAKWIAEKGAKHNEQIRVHDEQFREMGRRLTAAEQAADKVPVLEANQNAILQALNRAKTAGWGAAGGLVVLAGTVILSGGGS